MVNKVAPLAHTAATNKNAKTPGSKGLAAALFAAPGKGTAKLILASGSSGGTKSLKLKLPLFSEALKKGLAATATLKDKQVLPPPSLIKKATGADGAGRTASQQPVAIHMTLNAQKEALPKDEKSDVKKKPSSAAAPSLDLAMSLTGAMKSDGTKQSDALPLPSKADGQQQAVAAASAKPAVAQATQPIIRIVDLRKKPDAPTANGRPSAAQSSGSAPSNTNDQSVSFAQRLSAAHDAAMPVVDQPPASAATPSQTPLERLRAMAGSELSQATTMILKDGGGEIRLILKPESLGSVRIRMNVVDNKVEGKIIVDSAAVKHVFDGSVDALRRALTAEGFQTGSLSVSVGGQGTDNGERQQRQTPSEVQRIAAQRFERNVPGMESMSLGDLLVNVFV